MADQLRYPLTHEKGAQVGEPAITRDFGSVSSAEFDAGKGRWPCVKCGRNENEACNGCGACPNGRRRPSMLPESLRLACRTRPGWEPTPYAGTKS